MTDFNPLPQARPGAPGGAAPGALDKSVRQGTGGPPVADPASLLLSRPAPAPSPAGPTGGSGPKGYATGRRRDPKATAGGAANPVAGPTRAPGAWLGTGRYSPPGGLPPGAGSLPGDTTADAPADAPYLLSTLDGRLPNGTLPRFVSVGPSAPAGLGLLWIDTSGATPAARYWGGTAWAALTLPPPALVQVEVTGTSYTPDGTEDIIHFTGTAACLVTFPSAYPVRSPARLKNAGSAVLSYTSASPLTVEGGGGTNTVGLSAPAGTAAGGVAVLRRTGNVLERV